MAFRYVASGFQQDMEELFSRFIAPEESTQQMTKDMTEDMTIDEKPKNISLRFSRFSAVWRQMNFSLVFRHRINENDLREFVEEIYLLVLPNICVEHPYERRVSALYLLYSLFVKQPKNIYQKIRINSLYLEQFRDLIQISKQSDQLDVCFVWYKLLSFGAIDLVYGSRQIGPNYVTNIRATIGPPTKYQFFVDQFKTSVNIQMNELSLIHQNYQKFKEVLSEDNPFIYRECDIIKDNIFEDSKSLADQMLNTVVNNKSDTKTTTSAPQLNDSNESIETNENMAPDIGSKRRQLIEKSFQSKTCIKDEIKIERKYTPNGKNPKSKRGRPKVAKWYSKDL